MSAQNSDDNSSSSDESSTVDNMKFIALTSCVIALDGIVKNRKRKAADMDNMLRGRGYQSLHDLLLFIKENEIDIHMALEYSETIELSNVIIPKLIDYLDCFYERRISKTKRIEQDEQSLANAMNLVREMCKGNKKLNVYTYKYY